MFPNGPVQTMLIRFLSVWSPKPLLFTQTSQFHYQAVVGQIFQYDIKRRVINAMVHRLFTNILPDHWYLCLEQNNYFALDFGAVAMKYLLRIWCPVFRSKYWKFNKYIDWKKTQEGNLTLKYLLRRWYLVLRNQYWKFNKKHVEWKKTFVTNIKSLTNLWNEKRWPWNICCGTIAGLYPWPWADVAPPLVLWISLMFCFFLCFDHIVPVPVPVQLWQACHSHCLTKMSSRLVNENSPLSLFKSFHKVSHISVIGSLRGQAGWRG